MAKDNVMTREEFFDFLERHEGVKEAFHAEVKKFSENEKAPISLIASNKMDADPNVSGLLYERALWGLVEMTPDLVKQDLEIDTAKPGVEAK